MKKIFALLLAGMFLVPAAGFTATEAQVSTTTAIKTQLPTNAQAFIKTHFPEATIASMTTSEVSDYLVYTVQLSDKTELKFDAKGLWQEVKMKSGFVPAAIIPAKIAAYLKANHAGVGVLSIEKQSKRCIEVELEGDVELTFDGNGRIMEFLD